MKLGEKLDASSASLQRLLALDKTFDTLEQRIHEAARILGIHLAQAVPGTDSGDGTRAPLYNASRHEFALRWLLDRFRTHPDAHTCPIAWTFLRCLVQTIPPANLVKALNGLPFMPAIIDALEKTFPMDYLSPPPCPPAFDSGIPQTSKKRKRNATSQDIAPNQLATEPDNADSLSIFLDMTATLDTLVTLSKPATSSLRHNLLQSTLSMNLPDLIRFVKHWLAALLYCATPSIALGPTEWPELVTDSLNLLLQIWMLQPYSQASDKVVLSESFSRDCLWPATLLLASLRTTGSHSHHPVTESLGAIHLLERMIAQQVFVPARSAFIAKTGESDTSMQERAHISSMGLEERIQPLHSKMTALSSATNNDSATISQQAIPAMLDIAIRCTPISTPKRKIAESPWVNHLFTALTSLISEVQNPTSEGSLRPGNVILVDMLTVLRHRGLLLSKETLVNIVEDRCHLVIHGEQSRQSNHQLRNTPDFQLIATVLSMDASIFTDTGSIYSKSLLDALTLEGKVGSPSATHLSQSVFSADKEIEHTITNTVAVPLMKAFARTRNLQGFLAEWFTRLESDPTSSNHEWHIWTDFALQDAVGDVFEASLTATQISDLLELRRRPIADLALICHDPPNKRVLNGTLLPQALRQLHASSVLLKTMVGAIRSDEVLDATSTALHSLVMDIEHIFDQMPSGVDKEIDHFLLLLSQLYELWHPRWSATQTQPEMQRKATVTFSGNAVRHALQTVNSDDSSKSALHAADVAFVFICTICDMHRRVDARPPENDKTIAAVMRKAALGLRTPAIKSSKTYVTRRPGQFMAAMIRFPSLIEHVCGGESGSEVLREIIDPKSPLPSSLLTVLHGFINVIASSDYEHAKSDLFEEILKRLARLTADQHNPESAVDILLSCPIRSLSRQQRESSLNSIVDVILQSGTSLSSVVLEECLSLIVNLMESPNATAKIATNPSIVMAMAESLLKNSAMSDSNLRLFHELCTSLLRHILDTADQERSKAFIGGLSGLAAAFMNEQKEKSIQLCTGRITLLMVFFRSTEARLTTDMLTSLPHRSLSAVDSYIRRLYTQLSTCTDPHTSVLDEDSSAGSATVVTDAFVNFPATLLTCGGSSSTKYSQRIDSLLGKVLSSAETMKGVATKQQSVLPLLIKSYEQTSQRLVEESTSKLCTITEHLLARGLDAKEHYAIMQSFSTAVRKVPDSDKIRLAGQLLQVSESVELSAEKMVLVQCIISSIYQPGSKPSEDVTASSILPRILELLTKGAAYDVHVQLLRCLNKILKEKPSLVSQYSLEMTVEAMIALASHLSPLRDPKRGAAIYESLCAVTQSLLQFHRASLGGRLHLFVPLLQRLLSCLFVPTGRDTATKNRFKHPPWLNAQDHPLTVKHSRRFARLLTLLCNPPQSNTAGHRRKQETAPELIDETRKYRIQVGQHVHQILHYFCVLILNGKLGEGMRDSLTSGMWAVIEVIEMDADDSKGVKALSASMGNSERAVLRGIWEEYRRFGGAWRG